MSNIALISATGLGAMRGERLLFKDVSLLAAPGETVLLRGANGSGKTTLLRQLCGLSDPQSGTIDRPAKHHWIGHSNGLKAHETPRTHLRHWTKVWGSRADVSGVLDKMAMTRPADVPCRMLSAGQKRRTALGRLMLEARPLWLLDEPFSALDGEGKDLLAGLIAAHCKGGGAVIIALHGEAPIAVSREVEL